MTTDNDSDHLWYLIEGFQCPFSIDPSPAKSIEDLKKLIKKEREVDIANAILWMPLKVTPVIPCNDLSLRVQKLFATNNVKRLDEPCLVAKTFQNRDHSPEDPPLDIFIMLSAQTQPTLQGTTQWSTPSRDDQRLTKPLPRKRNLSHSDESDSYDKRNTVPGQSFHTPTKSLLKVKEIIRQILEKHRPEMRQLVENAGHMPLLTCWVPKKENGDTEREISFRSHIENLAIPAVQGLPSLLLHDLGSVTSIINEKQAHYIDDIFSLHRHSVIINTAGSGKTRLGLHGLCQNWGFYGVIKQSGGIGSGDLWDLLSTLNESRDYDSAKRLGSGNEHAKSHMHDKVKHRILQFLLARFLILNLLISEASKCEGGLRLSDHRLLWVLLQACPTDLLKEDIFLELATALRISSTEHLKSLIKEEYSNFRPVLEREPLKTGTKHRPLYCFLDKIQLTTSIQMGEFQSGDGRKERPLLRPIWETLTETFQMEKMLLILSGTTISESSLKTDLSSALFRVNSYDIKREIGAFDDAEVQKKYVKYYLPVASNAFLKRTWGWCRGRYRSTATIVELILTSGPHSPHKILNAFVKSSTKFSPTDGRLADEHAEPHVNNLMVKTSIGFDFDRLNEQQINTLRDTLYDQIVHGSSTLLPSTPEDEAAFIEYGLARTKLDKHTIDEPLVIVAAWIWLDSKGHYSLLECLRRDIGKHSPRKNGFEAYLAFYFRKVFEKTPRLDDVFTFRSDFACRKNTDLRWQQAPFELVTVSVPEDTNQRTVSIVTQLCGPSSNVGLIAKTDDDVVNWVSRNEEKYVFCFPTESAGPDIIFFVRNKETQQLLLVAVQAKRYDDVSKPTLTYGVRTVTPSFLWKSKEEREAGEASNCPSAVATRFLEALMKNEHVITAPTAKYPILFASWSASALLDRTLDITKSGQEVDLDTHPLAELHLQNFNNISTSLANSSYRNDTEQEVVVFAEKQYDDIELRRSKRLKT